MTRMTSASPPIRSVESVDDDVAAAVAAAMLGTGVFSTFFPGVVLVRSLCFLGMSRFLAGV
jgi:hypothetical protein